MKVTKMRQFMSRCFRLPACWLFMFATTAYCGAVPTEIARTIDITRKDAKFAGYELGNLPLNALVKLKLTVNDVDAKADFVLGSGVISSTGGLTAWTRTKDEKNLFEAESARSQFRRDHKLYVAYAHGRWAVPKKVGKKAAPPPIWEVDVFQVLIETGALPFPEHNKLLATAGHPLTATLHVMTNRTVPSGTVVWSHPLAVAGDFTPQELQTVFVAKTALTPANQEDKQHVKVTFTPTNGEPSSDSHPLNITAPKLFSANKSDGPLPGIRRTPWINSNRPLRKVNLINKVVIYRIFDQFGDRIMDSDRGTSPNRKDIKIREDVLWDGVRTRTEALAWVRRIPTTPDWINNNRNWFPDSLTIVDFPPATLRDPATIPDEEHPDRNPRFNFTDGQEVLWVRNHVQHATVSGNATLDTLYTDNVLSITVDYRAPPGRVYDQIRLKVTYTLNVTKPKP